MAEIAATVWLTVGLTFYGGDFVGSGLACGGVYTESEGVWAAVPIEWVQGGYVSCGDMLEAIFADGRRVMVPIRDTGCHLHHAVWDTGRPFGADFPNWPWWRDGTPTGTGRVRVKRQDGSWWTPPPMMAWATQYCEGPLTVARPEAGQVESMPAGPPCQGGDFPPWPHAQPVMR